MSIRAVEVAQSAKRNVNRVIRILTACILFIFLPLELLSSDDTPGALTATTNSSELSIDSLFTLSEETTNDSIEQSYYRQIIARTSDNIHLAKAHHNLGYSLSINDRIIESIDHLNHAVELYASINNIEDRARAYMTLGRSLKIAGDNIGGLTSLESSLELLEGTNDSISIANVLVNIATVYSSCQSTDLALEYNHRALSIYEKSNHKYQVYCLNNIAYEYDQLEKYDMAAMYYKKGIDMAEGFEFWEMYSIVVANLIGMRIKNEEYPSAKEALRLFDKLDNESLRPAVKYTMALSRSNILFTADGIQSDLTELKQILDWAEEVGHAEVKLSTLELLSDNYESLGEYKRALGFAEKQLQLREQLISEKYVSELDGLEERRKIKRKLMSEELQIQRANSLIRLNVIGIIILLSAMLLTAFSIRNKKRLNQKLHKQNEELKIREIELENKYQNLATYIRSNTELKHFAHIAAHDLKGPLRTIYSYGKLLESRAAGKMTDREKIYSGYIVDNAGRMLKLIDELLYYSTISYTNMTMSQIDMNVILNEVKEELQNKYDKLEIHISVDNNIPLLEADKDAMRRIAKSVIENSIIYRKGDSANISIQHYLEGPNHIIEFSDSGIGIDKAHLQNIVNPFVQLHTKDRFGGTGLGLAISKGLIEKQDGKMNIESILNVGTKVIFSLPIGNSTHANLTVPS